MKFNERIKFIRKHLGLNQKEFGDILGVSQRAISNWESGRNEPSIEVLNSISTKWAINPTWLLTGRGEMFLKDESKQIAIQKTQNNQDEITLNYYPEVYAAAGYGATNQDFTPVETITLPKKFLIEILNIFPTYPLDIIKVIGDSMEPYIQDGETVLVERNPKPRNGDIVIANINGEVYIKRIEKDPFGKWIKFISDNPLYETFKIEGEDLKSVDIIGIVRAKIKIF